MSVAPIFALDIGTRNVIGLVARPEGDRWRVLAMAVREHDERAMRDGQIHDIPKVVRVVREIKRELESACGMSLSRVAIAAAGRALQTNRARASAEVGLEHTIDKERLRVLELRAIQDAVGSLKGQDNHCVGYSIVHYYLDGQPIGNLEGQRGRVMEVELIATFLPRVVTDSLVAVCHQSGLEVQNLTLEPIAAINAAVPPNMRALNLALIDIGAGTSDIALTHGGAVTAYAMVPQAGDAITEALAEAYLLDFLEAERVKHALSQDGAVTFTDVLGLQHSFASEAVRQQVRGAVETLVTQISEHILSLNGKPPAAAIMIGGGSLFPALGPMLAKALGLPDNRVAVRGTEMIKRMESIPELLQGPMGVTPVGIALAAHEAPGFRFLTVYVDDRVINLEDWGVTRVLDALVAAGYQPSQLAAKPGRMITLRVNGETRPYPAAGGGHTRIMVNGQIATVDTLLGDGAQVSVMVPQEGAAEVPLRLSDVVDLRPIPVTLNGLGMDCPPLIRLNDEPVMGDRHLQDGDAITADRTVHGLLLQAGLLGAGPVVLQFSLDQESHEWPLQKLEVTINGDVATLATELQGGEVIEAKTRHLPPPSIKNVLPPGCLELNVRVNDTWLTIENPSLRVIMGTDVVPVSTPVTNGARLSVDRSQTLTVGGLLPSLQLVYPGLDDEDVLITVDGKYADLITEVTPQSIVELLTENAPAAQRA